MSKLLITFCLLLILLIPTLALADDYGLEETGRAAGLSSELTKTSIEGLVGKIIKALLGVVGIIFFGLMLYGGFRWMTARGETKLIEQAKETIISASVGLFIVLAAYAITHFVIKSLT